MDVRGYVLRVVAASAVCAMVSVLTNNKTATGKIAGMLCSIFLAITVLSPLVNLRFQSFAEYFGDLSFEAEQYVEEGKSSAQQSAAGIIKAQTESYILDKANRMGLEISVEVELDDDNNSIPCGVLLSGNVSPYAKQVLSEFMENNLGIAKENQKWTG